MRTIEEIVCPICGFRNSIEQERCVSCGAKVEVFFLTASEDEARARRYQQEDFEWKWALIGAALFTVLQLGVLGLLPALLDPFDPQGLSGLLLSVPLFLVGGVGLGACSPGKTFLEPAVGAMLASAPTLGVVAVRTPEGFEPSLLAYIVFTAMGVLMALFGALAGEWIQLTSARATAARSPSRRGASRAKRT
jgi:hypothetical protein